MSISFGSPGTSANVNVAFVSRTGNTDTIGQLGLLNEDAASGSTVANLQRTLNSYASFIGTTNAQVFNVLPTWSSNELGTSDDTLKARVESIDAAFSDLNAYIVDASDLSRGLVSTGLQSFAGAKTFEGVVEFDSAVSSAELRIDFA